jgi:Arc/MetJ-type ribon-helix-helix transcriptional regulator
VIKKLLVHCNRIEPISSRSITLTPGQFNTPTTIDLNLNDGKNYLRKELKREIVLPTECDIDSLESYLENGYLHFKCLLARQQTNDLKHAQIVSLPRLELKNNNSDQSTVIKRSMLNLSEREAIQQQQQISELVKKKLNSSRSDFINKSILKLNSDELSDPKTDICLNESLNSDIASAQFQFESSPRQQQKHQQNRSRHQSLPSGSSTKSVRFNMNNRTFQLEDAHNNSNNNNNNNNHHISTADDLIQAAHRKNESSSPSTPPNSCKLIRHNSSSSNGHRHRHRSNSSKSKSDANASSSSHRRTSSNNSNNLSTRLSNDLINDGFNCITKDGLENIFLTYFFKLPSCSPSDRTQVRIEKNSILKLKIIH